MPRYSKFRDEAYLHGRIPIPLPAPAVAKTFPAVIYDRVAIQIAQDDFDPIMFAQCPDRLLPLYMGSYSFFEVEPDVGADDPRWLGIWRIKPNGRFGEAGKCDGAIELNRLNVAIERLRMIVEMHEGPIFDNSNCPSSDDVSSSEEYWFSSDEVRSTKVRYWFDLKVPREDCAIPYVVTSSPFNDFPP